jgi:hypothetical protein
MTFLAFWFGVFLMFTGSIPLGLIIMLIAFTVELTS